MVLAFTLELQKKLLHFATGSDRVPVGGMADLNFKISKIDVPTDWYVPINDKVALVSDWLVTTFLLCSEKKVLEIRIFYILFRLK